MDVKDDLISQIFSLYHLISDKLRKSPIGSRLSIVQLQTLRYIRKNDQPTMKSVAEFLGITPPSATAIVDRLIAEKLIKRTEDGHDRRIVRLSITALGEEEVKEGLEFAKKAMREIIENLSPQENDTLTKIFKKILSGGSNPK